jgi:ER lumen protein retaining receptor
MPQLIVLQRKHQAENLTSLYVTSLGAYRGLYIINWIWRFYSEPHYRAWIPWIAGVVQTALYTDFFYHFYQCRIKHGMKAVILPQ